MHVKPASLLYLQYALLSHVCVPKLHASSVRGTEITRYGEIIAKGTRIMLDPYLEMLEHRKVITLLFLAATIKSQSSAKQETPFPWYTITENL